MGYLGEAEIKRGKCGRRPASGHTLSCISVWFWVPVVPHEVRVGRCIAFVSNSNNSADLYVSDTTGSDGAECGLSETGPCESLYRVLFAVDTQGGTVTNIIHVDAGTYTGRNNREIDFENVPDVNDQISTGGNATSSFIVPITIQLWIPGDNNENVAIFDAQGATTVFLVSGPVALTLRNLTFARGSAIGNIFFSLIIHSTPIFAFPV